MRSKTHPQIAGAVAGVLAALILCTRLTADAPVRTILDGVYTEAQAQRGLETYTQNCSRCHQPDLTGTGVAPALQSPSFIDAWREGYLDSLFLHMQTRMPPLGLEGSLTDRQYVDIIAYVLSFNMYPKGANELTTEALSDILFVGPDGPKPLPPSSTVRVVGCLTRSGDSWTVNRATEPSRVRNGSETDRPELDRSAHADLGTRAFRLANLEDDHSDAELLSKAGQKVQVKGVYSGQGDAAKISVFSFETLEQACAK